MNNQSQIMIICIFSAIVGGIIGILGLIPPLLGWAFLAFMLFTAPFILIYFKKIGIIKNIDVKNWTIIGAIAGGASAIGFCIAYIPCALVLNFFFKITSYIWAKAVFLNFFSVILFPILIALTSAMFNAFSGYITATFINMFYRNDK
ncbi:hypothetical protein II906_07295 [bacterium]|nr:hypothetical protein [bacterium]